MDEVGTTEMFELPSATMDAAEAQAAKDRDLLAALKARPKVKPNRAQRRAQLARATGKRTVEVKLLAFARWQAAGSPDKTIIPKSKRRRKKR